MKTLRWWLLSLFSWAFAVTYAQQDQVTVSVNEVTPGSVWNLDVALDNAPNSNYTAFQMDLALPVGFEWYENTFMADMRMAGHTCSVSLLPTGKLRVVAYSVSNSEIFGNNGNLFHLSLGVKGEVSEGNYTVKATHILFAKRDGTEARLQDSQGDFLYKKSDVQQSYTIVYMVDGEEYQRQSLQEGSVIPAIDAPVKEGYTFVGWEGLPEVMPAKDLEVTGTFTVNTYTITYILDGKEYGTQKVAYGEKIEPLVVENTDEYLFMGWEEIPATMPAHDLTIYGTTELTGIATLEADQPVEVYNLAGKHLLSGITWKQAKTLLKSGIYVVNGQKVVVSK